MLPTYDFSLVVFSVVIAIISSLTALDLAGRVTAATDRGRNFWVAGGAVAMGSGIWSMHFIAMLAYKLPVPTAYNGQIVFVSLVVAIFVAGLSLYIISHESLGKFQFWVSGSIMGGAIALMHYIGMAALQLEAKSVYNTPRVALSVLVAIAGSYAALGLTFYGRKDATVPFWRKSASVLIMGSAIAGIHYIGMSAVCWQVTNTSAIGQYSQKHSSLALAIGIATLIILGLALQAAFVDRRLKIEVTLAESQRRLATLIDSLPGIVFSTNNDPNWTMTYLSEGCFNLTGYHSFELVGTQGAYNAITYPEDLPNVFQSIDAAIANQQPYVVEYRIKTKSGQYKWLWEKGSAVFSDSGQLLGLEGFITDITKLKDSQEGLRQAEAKYRSIFENAVEGIFQTTIDGKYISANPALARIYGYESPQALIALVEIDRQLYVEPHRRQEFLRLIQQHGSISGFESKVYRQDGSIIWISENVRTVKNASGVTIYYEGTVEDISDRKQLSDRLESRVEERTAQLRKANYQLQSEIVERQKAEQEVRLLQAMTQAISESPDFHSALTVALQKICQFTGWSFGEAWIPSPNSQNLTYSCSWYSNQKLAEFSNASKKITFAADVGLPGRVWAAKQPEWIEDVSIAGNNIFLRASLAKQVGIKAGLGVPIVGSTSSSETTEVLAVLVFFMFDSCHEDKRQVELVRAIATGLDTLMQRKRAESALRKSEERYRAVVEQTSEGIFLIDTETKRILQSNAAFERLLGYTSEEILQLQLYDLVALAPEIIDKNALRVLQEQHDFIAEAPHRRKDGSLVWTEVNVSCIFYNDRNVFCAIVRDITDRKLAEMALHSSLATNRALINAIPDLIFRLNREGVFVNFKASKDNNLLLSPDYFMGKNVYDVMPLAVAQPTMHYIHQALATNEVQIFEYQLQLEQLRDYEARLVVSAKDEVMAIVRDITERKRAEADMHHALAKEKELSELKSRFVTMTSHEFRTPLTTILSSTELLQKYSFKWSEEKKTQHFWRIQTSVKQMTQLLEDVLLIGKAEAEKIEFQPFSLDLKQFCADLADEIQTLTEKHQITFASYSDRTLGQMDEKLLRHIFSNLLVNAVKYSPQGGEIKFELICEQDTAIFRVQDSGIGIPKNEQAKLFDSFHRASNVGTISGTGLGLAIVKKSVDLHAGKIEVESQVDIGTTFIVSLPLNC